MLIDSYGTEVVKVLSVWSGFRDLPGAVTGRIDDAAVARDLTTGLSDAERPIFEELNARTGATV